MIERARTTTKTDIDQHLRALAQRLAGLSQTFGASLQRHQHLQRSNDRITGRGVIEANDMPRVLTTDQPIALQQFSDHIAVANIGTNEWNRKIGKG